MTRTALLRMLDANANRALEGLRVCEDVVRFHLGTPRIFRRIRALRHGVAEALTRLPVRPTELVRARNSARDPGRTAPATAVPSLERLLLINFQRAKEALRVLEEAARLLAPRQTAAFQRLRFRTYEAEREALLRVEALRHR